MAQLPEHDPLQAVIDVQNEIAATGLDFSQILQLVCERARSASDADSATIELIEDGERVAAAVAGRAPVNAASTAGVAIRHADEVAGLLRIEAAAARRFTAEQFQALELLAGVVAIRLSTGTVSSATLARDTLTGLPSRRAFAERLGVEAARARRYHHPLALCIFEVSGLAAVNERGGRVAGDEVLRRVARILSGARTADESFRLGGDQFAILMPQTDAGGAEAAGARLSASVVAAGLADGRIGASFGAAETAGDPVALHEDAAERLRLAKRRRAAARVSRERRPQRPRVVAVVRGRGAPGLA